jgi:beta-galactosidase/beta-glucuronidase
MVHYFSGTGVYTHAIDVTPEQLANGHVVLDLGDVRDIAEVRVNGTDQGLAWAPPCNVDITKGLQAGRNTLEIRVTNEWTNRIEGDKNLPDGRKVRKRGLKAAVQAAWAMG